MQKRKNKDIPKRPKKRSGAVTVVAILMFIDSLAALLAGILSLWLILPQIAQYIPTLMIPALEELADYLEVYQSGNLALPKEQIIPFVEAVLGILTGLFGLFFTLKFLQLKAWGWTWLMLYNGVVLMILFVDYIHGEPDYFSLFIAALAILLINQKEVRSSFNIDNKHAETRVTLTENISDRI